MRVEATSKFIGTSARKIGLVAGLIRGRKVADAQSVLANTNKRATGPVGKALESALANAQNNHNLKKADLVIESVFVGPGPTLKRFRPRAKGAASSIRKRSSHIKVILSDDQLRVASSELREKATAKNLRAKPASSNQKLETKSPEEK